MTSSLKVSRVALAATIPAALLLAVLQPDPARAQATPALPPQIDAGAIERQVQQNRRQLEERLPSPEVQSGIARPAAPPSEVGPPGGATFLLRSVAFDASTFISKDELDAIAAKYVGRPADLSTLQQIVKEVNDIYAERGIITARASLPPQKVDTGDVKVALTEGRIGKVTVEGNQILSEELIRRRVLLPPGEIADVNELTRQVSVFNRTSDAQVRAALQPGSQFGLTDISLAVTEPRADTFQLFADNQGVQTVGRYEAGLLYRRFGLFGIDDRLTLYGVKSLGNIAGNASYNVPFNDYGGRAGLSYSRGSIRIVNGPFRTLDVTGESQTAAFNLSHPLFASGGWLLLGNASVAYSNSTSEQTKTLVTDNDTLKTSVGVTLSYLDEMRSFSVSPSYSAARSRFFLAHTNDSYNLANGIFSGSARLPADFLVTTSGSFQVASEKLLPGDQLIEIGGPTTVRGYPTNAFAGGTGYFAQSELHHAVPNVAGLDAFAFVDHGRVFSTFPAEKKLTSAGLGLSMQFDPHLSAEISAGFPISRGLDKESAYQLYFRVTLNVL